MQEYICRNAKCGGVARVSSEVAGIVLCPKCHGYTQLTINEIDIKTSGYFGIDHMIPDK